MARSAVPSALQINPPNAGSPKGVPINFTVGAFATNGTPVVAFLDFNNDGIRETAEPQASALATFVDSVPRSCKVKVSGDRPGGSGGAGKPLIITVNCNEPSTVTAQTTLTPRTGAHARAATVERKKKPKTKKR